MKHPRRKTVGSRSWLAGACSYLATRLDTAPTRPLWMLVTLQMVVAGWPDTGKADVAAAVEGQPISSTDQRFLAGLRQRGLLRLAETYCRERLAEPALEPRRRAELTIELARNHALRAMQSVAAERPGLWHRAHLVGADFQAQHPSHPFVILVQLHDALLWVDQGELLRAEAEIAADPEPLLSAARRHLRTALRALRQLDTDVAIARRRRPSAPGAAPLAGLTPTELAAVAQQIAYHAARALRHQGQCYAATSADRTNSLSAALERLEPLAELPAAYDLVWQSRMDRVVCQRLLGDSTRALQALSKLLTMDPPAGIARRGRAEQIRLLLATDRAGDALTLARSTEVADGPASADLELARLEAMIAGWRSAAARADSTQAAQLAREAAVQVRHMEQQHGPYWLRQGELLLAGVTAGPNLAGDGTALAQAAQGLFRSGQLTEALAMYDRVAAQALTQGEVGQAFDAAFTAATIAHDQVQRGRGEAAGAALNTEAMRRYVSLAHRLPNHPRAAEAHLLAIFHAAEEARSQRGAGRHKALEQYAALIDEHLRRWPQAATAGHVRWWLGQLRAAQRQWQEAIAAYQDIKPDQPQHEAAVRATARCYDQWLAELAVAGKDTRSQVNAAQAYFHRHITAAGQDQPQRWDPAARLSALATARILLRHTQHGHAQAERLLVAALDADRQPAADWEGSARRELVLALAGQGRIAEAQVAAGHIPPSPPAAIAELVGQLVDLAEASATGTGHQLADLALRVADRAASDDGPMEEATTRQFLLDRAVALAASGRQQEALSAFEALAGQYPDDGQIRAAHAALLVTSRDTRALNEALSKWQQVQQTAAPGSERWFRARYGQAQAYVGKNEKEKAAKLIKLTQALHPELGGSEMRARFLRLLSQCE